MERIPDGHFLGTVASAPSQNDDIGVLEENEDRTAEPDRLQPLPIKPGTLGLEFEFTSKLDES
jgi:hypothetical protein